MGRSIAYQIRVLIVFGFISYSHAWAVTPSEQLLPPETKGFVSVPDMKRLGDQWEKTQLGKLARDPVMKPFAEDLQRQIRERLDQGKWRLGITWDDVREIHGGEVCWAFVQPGEDETESAMAMIVDVTGRATQVKQLRNKIDASMTDRKAPKSTSKVGATQLTMYHVVNEERAFETDIVLFERDNQLIVADSQDLATSILVQFDDPKPSLSDQPDFQHVMSESARGAGELSPDIRWFLEPIGYAYVMRVLQGGQRQRGRDVLKVLEEQGFDAIEGVGGHINLATGDHEILHRTFVFAPGDASRTQKYRLAARMLNFPDSEGLNPLSWVPRELATHTTLAWKMKDSFEYVKTLVDGLLEDEGFFDNLMLSFQEDLKYDVRTELVQYLGTRLTVMTRHLEPADTKGEQVLAGVELTNPEEVNKGLVRILTDDPQVRKIVVNDHTIWEIIEEEEVEDELALVVIQGVGFTPVPGVENNQIANEPPLLSHMALTVLHGQLIIGSDVGYVTDLVKNSMPTGLEKDDDFRRVKKALDNLGSGKDSLRFFSRTDQEYRTTYELLKLGKMPEADTILARVINRLAGPKQPKAHREQRIDASKLPDYEKVRPYLGPAGTFMRSTDKGWVLTGALLTKDDAANGRQAVQTSISTASLSTAERN